MDDGFVEVGRVAGPHGVKGKIRVATHSGDPSGLLGASVVRLAARGTGRMITAADFEVRTAQRSGDCAVFSLEGIDTVEAAKGWTGAAVSVPRAELPPPAEDEYYWVDLVGCEVLDGSGLRIGVVEEIERGPAHDWLVIRRETGEEGLLPVVSAFILKVDLSGRRIVASPPEGW